MFNTRDFKKFIAEARATTKANWWPARNICVFLDLLAYVVSDRLKENRIPLRFNLPSAPGLRITQVMSIWGLAPQVMAGLLRDKPATVFVPDTVGVAVGQGGLVDPAVRALRSFQTAHGWKLSLARSYRTGGGRSLVNRILTNPEMERPFAVARCIFAVFNSEGAHHDESDSVPASIPNGNFSFTQSSVQPPREVGHTGIYLRTKLLM